MLLHNKMADLEVGQTLCVRATDPSTERDIPKFCRFLGHALLHQENDGKEYVYWLRKGA